MIKYFYKQYWKSQLNPILIKNSYLLETNSIFFTKFFFKNKKFMNTTFLFFSMLAFYTWIRFIIQHKLAVLIISEYNSLNLYGILFKNRYHFSLLSENTWIPGLLSNKHEIIKGQRYILNIQTKELQLKKNPDFIYLGTTKRLLISQETTSQLIPQFVILSSITNIMSSYFILLFVPKFKKMQYNMYNKYPYLNTLLYHPNFIYMKKYILMQFFKKTIPSLIYLSLLSIII